ncbi:MAG TPA: hypothetical protein VM406_15830 [Noviherbaspirillum sp.]|nr:hypothetical protein [Noviherbaspirillum sp.]
MHLSVNDRQMDAEVPASRMRGAGCAELFQIRHTFRHFEAALLAFSQREIE